MSYFPLRLPLNYDSQIHQLGHDVRWQDTEPCNDRRSINLAFGKENFTRLPTLATRSVPIEKKELTSD